MNSIVHWLRERVATNAHLTLDSRLVAPGDVFLACPGAHSDGRRFMAQAVGAGAAVVVYEASDVSRETAQTIKNLSVPALPVTGLRAQLGQLASEWYGNPSRELAVIAITGTNGKTSCANWVAQALTGQHEPCGVIGTLGLSLPGGQVIETGLTTPDVITMHRSLRRLVDEGAVAAAVEASSIGLDQGRMDDVHIAIAAFTNLTQDHLDVHGNMQAYEAAKLRLFQWPGLEAAVLNLDDAAGRRFAVNATASTLVGYCRNCVETAEIDPARPVIRAHDVQTTPDGQLFTLCGGDGAEALIRTPLAGGYNVDNLLLVAGVLYARGWSVRRSAAALAGLSPVPGRLQAVHGAAAGPLVLVDYAHTPDALQVVLNALRPLAQARGGQLWCVFGCGGNRDTGKRPLMGRAAVESADYVVVTSDNPRAEEPGDIIAQIVDGLAQQQSQKVRIEPIRSRAILQAVWSAQTADVVLVAGKGHETTQEVAGVKHPFSDAQWARLALTLPEAATVTTDTRVVGPGDVFVALRGERFDGHDFIDQAARGGALAAVVAQPVSAAIPCITVGDTGRALLQMGAAWRRRFVLPLIAVTGSNGKTTTKEMIAAILNAWWGPDRVLATCGNLNNDIGVPLTLLRMREGHRAAVVELGMNHPGEIAVLADVAAPTIALVNNAQREHQEFMHTVEAVARENGAALAALPADGIAVYPGDDPYSDVWNEQAGTRARLRFGLADGMDVSAADVRAETSSTHFTLHTPVGDAAVKLPVAGRHNLRNALAAAACAIAAGCPLSAVVQGLESFSAVAGRLQLRRLPDGVVLVDDTYNANPDSVRAAIDVLAGLPQPQALVLGDMGEVGTQGPQMHAEVGRYARERGIAHLLALGDATRESVQAFGQGGLACETPEAVAAQLGVLQPASILVKGSRFMRMERVVALVDAAHSAPAGTGGPNAS